MKNHPLMYQLVKDLRVTCDDFMTDLLDLYNCQDWGMSFQEFLEHAAEVVCEAFDEWQGEEE
ncbi:MAG: hypothetical protein IKU45_02090 [Clostridia bacterium]|nr:hypothetical protein [Clostridia bacterium]